MLHFLLAKNTLDEERPRVIRSLPESLSESVLKRISDVRGALHFLSNDGFQKITLEQTIKIIQIESMLFQDQPEGGYNFSNSNHKKLFAQKRSFLETEWKPPISADVINHWEDRAHQIRNTTNITKAFQKFISLTREFESFEQCVREAAAALDRAIEMEMDRLRGK